MPAGWVSPEASLLGSSGHPPMCPHMAFSLGILLLSHLIVSRPPPLGLHFILITSLEMLSPNTVTLGVRASAYKGRCDSVLTTYNMPYRLYLAPVT